MVGKEDFHFSAEGALHSTSSWGRCNDIPHGENNGSASKVMVISDRNPNIAKAILLLISFF
jgi:photosystem II stability/assembly factor-like uncharacterized protein